jgi:hypothetical protein
MDIVAMRIGNLSPIVHQYNYALYRVPLCKEGNSYTIYVADGFNRVFDEETLPDEIKSKMAMILARGNPIMYDHEVTQLNLMTTPLRNDDFIEVGWRVSDMWFVVVLNYNSLMALRGE